MRDEDRSRWTRLVADFESVDLSQREFAQERGISLSNLRYWIYKLRKESRPLVAQEPEHSDQAPEQSAATGASRLLPVRVVASAAKRRQPRVEVLAADDVLLELALPSGATLQRFPAGTDLAYLRVIESSIYAGGASAFAVAAFLTVGALAVGAGFSSGFGVLAVVLRAETVLGEVLADFG